MNMTQFEIEVLIDRYRQAIVQLKKSAEFYLKCGKIGHWRETTGTINAYTFVIADLEKISVSKNRAERKQGRAEGE